MTIPILFLSDAVSCSSGLGRITRDIATRLHENCSDIFDVATVGYGAAGSRKIPFKEYHLHSVDNWLVPELPEIWDDWAQGREGTLFCIWDMSRLYWLGSPETNTNPRLRYFAERKDIKKWAYHALDAEGPNGGLSHRIAQTMKGFDRVLDYSPFSTKVTGNTDWLPHGIDTSVFKPYPKREARQKLIEQNFTGLTHDTVLVGIVATNQARKNWQLAMETVALMIEDGIDVRVWAHTDILERYWSIGNLIVDYGLGGRVAVTNARFTDEQMAWMYSACDVTMGIGPEGWGYPICESLACGVPCVTGSYGAQGDYVPERMLIEPNSFYYEGAYCSKRPVYHAQMWAARTEYLAHESRQVARHSLLPEWIDWNNLWPKWEAWFRSGYDSLQS